MLNWMLEGRQFFGSAKSPKERYISDLEHLEIRHDIRFVLLNGPICPSMISVRCSPNLSGFNIRHFFRSLCIA